MLFPQMVEAEIGHDPVDPSVERAFEPEPRQIDVGTQECFLINILAVFLRSGEMNRESQN